MKNTMISHAEKFGSEVIFYDLQIPIDSKDWINILTQLNDFLWKRKYEQFVTEKI
jgi:hypothetical protein